MARRAMCAAGPPALIAALWKKAPRLPLQVVAATHVLNGCQCVNDYALEGLVITVEDFSLHLFGEFAGHLLPN